MTPAGLPHSETHGSPDACSSPWLFAACRVLPRLPAPRHPPCALTALDQCSLRSRERRGNGERPSRLPSTHVLALAENRSTVRLRYAYDARLLLDDPNHPNCQISWAPRRRRIEAQFVFAPSNEL